VLNEIMAKLNPRERLMGIGAIVFIVAWLVGFLLASVSYAGIVGGNVYNNSGGTGLGFIGLLAAIAAIVVIYLKYAPNMNITWPVPVGTILMVLSGVVGVVALYLLWTNFSNSNDWNSVCGGIPGCPSWPITDWLAVLGGIVGGAIMCWGAYQEYLTTKAA
jgi:hypothetical protein